MEVKGMDNASVPRSSSAHVASVTANVATGTQASSNEGAWWRWTHGKSGSVSSSSEAASGAASSPQIHSPTAATSHMDTTDTNTSAAVPTWETMRWQRRTTRTGLQDTGLTASPPLSASTSPKFLVASSSSSSSSASTSPLGSSHGSQRASSSTIAKRKVAVQSSVRSIRDGATKTKRLLGSSSSTAVGGLGDFALPASAREIRSVVASVATSVYDHGEIKWTGGPGKRKVVKKDKKYSRPLYQTRGLTGGGANSHQSLHSWLGEPLSSFGGDDESLDVNMLEEKRCLSPTSTVSTMSSSGSVASTASSSVSSPWARPDPVINCARAVLEDCYRQKYAETSGMRKRTLEGRVKLDDAAALNARLYSYDGASLSKSPEGGGGLSCGSSSSDDELSQFSSLDASLNGGDKSDRDSDSTKLTREELYRQLMLENDNLSSSPDFDCFSPHFEEKGLPVEIRYQLPLALGTANETEKECAICQIRYGIGDHIVTLPCQHFFHACCVDKWLWNHTSCPLCRTVVTVESDVEQVSLKHQFTACSQSDQEAMRRKMRSSSHSAGFRPVVPAVDHLESHMAGMSIQEESAEANPVQYLVCPTPQRPHRK